MSLGVWVLWMHTRVPTATRSNRSITSALVMRTQPCDRGTPMGQSSGQPWM